MTRDEKRGISRRDFVASAVAIGGTSALSACVGREMPLLSNGGDELDAPTGGDPSALPDGQHIWNEYLVHDIHGNTVLPTHQLMIGLEYVGSTPPTEAERTQVEDALTTLERAFQWGTGGDPSAAINPGLLWMLGYAQRYFDRFGGGDVEGLTSAEEVLEEVGEDPEKADDFDALLALNSDFGSVVLAAEEALFGERDAVNGEPVEATLEGVFEKTTRRTGVTGKGNVAPEMDEERVPDAAPLSMGFRSGLADNQATEDTVTFDSGPFAGGTTLHASRLHIDVGSWYDQGLQERVGEMFCPAHDAEDVGDTAEELGSNSRITKEDAESIEEYAEKYDRVGHSQKVARARDEDFQPRMLRRTEGVATDVAESGVGFNFNSVQRSMDAFVDARKAMNVDEYDVDVADDDHGIVDFLETRARGTFVVPPRDRRALPTL